MNIESNKSHNREKLNIRIFLKDYNIPLSDMKGATQNKCKLFAMGMRVTLFGLNNLEFDGKIGVIK